MKDIVIIILLGIIVIIGVFEGLKFYKKQMGMAAISAYNTQNVEGIKKDAPSENVVRDLPDIESSSNLILKVEATGAATIKGIATTSAEVYINNNSVIVDKNGEFSTKIDVDEGENVVDIIANDKNGNFDEKTVTINYVSDLGEKMASVSGTVNSKSATQIIINSDGRIYNVLFDKNTKFRRKFVGVSSFDEIKPNDTLSVIGTWADVGNLGINASVIRDSDIGRKLGIFFGQVISISENGFVMKTLTRRDIKVIVAKSIVKVDEKVRVMGLWDKLTNTINEVSEVKSFGI